MGAGSAERLETQSRHIDLLAGWDWRWREGALLWRPRVRGREGGVKEPVGSARARSRSGGFRARPVAPQYLCIVLRQQRGMGMAPAGAEASGEALGLQRGGVWLGPKRGA